MPTESQSKSSTGRAGIFFPFWLKRVLVPLHCSSTGVSLSGASSTGSHGRCHLGRELLTKNQPLPWSGSSRSRRANQESARTREPSTVAGRTKIANSARFVCNGTKHPPVWWLEYCSWKRFAKHCKRTLVLEVFVLHHNVCVCGYSVSCPEDIIIMTPQHRHLHRLRHILGVQPAVVPGRNQG